MALFVTMFDVREKPDDSLSQKPLSGVRLCVQLLLFHCCMSGIPCPSLSQACEVLSSKARSSEGEALHISVQLSAARTEREREREGMSEQGSRESEGQSGEEGEWIAD